MRFVQIFPCINCGYDLQGLTIDSNCPECGGPIARSWNQGLLRFSDLRWLRRVQRGLMLMSLGFYAPLLGVLACGVFGVISLKTSISANVLNVICLVSLALSPVTYVTGVYLFTAPEPGTSSCTQGKRIWVRFSSICVPVVGAAGVGLCILAILNQLAIQALLYLSGAYVCIACVAIHIWMCRSLFAHLVGRSHGPTASKTKRVQRSIQRLYWKPAMIVLAVGATGFAMVLLLALIWPGRVNALILRNMAAYLALAFVLALFLMSRVSQDLEIAVRHERVMAAQMGDERAAIRDAAPPAPE